MEKYAYNVTIDFIIIFDYRAEADPMLFDGKGNQKFVSIIFRIKKNFKQFQV